MIPIMEIPDIDQQLDVTGMNCPMPVLRTKMFLAKLTTGQVLSVLSTDPHSVPDFRAFCDHTGHELIKTCERDDLFEFIIRKA